MAPNGIRSAKRSLRVCQSKMPFDSHKLCRLIENFPCLYNPNLPEYSKKDEAERAWREISEEMNESVTECKTRWYNIRGNFSRNLRTEIYSTNGERKKYYLEEQLNFLRPYMRSFNKLRFLNDKLHEIDFSEQELPEEQIFLQCEQSQDEDPGPSTKRRKQSRDSDPLASAVMTLIEKVREEKQEESPDMSFFRSLLPYLNKMNDRKKHQFRTRVLDIVTEVLYGEEEHKSPSQRNYIKIDEESQEF